MGLSETAFPKAGPSCRENLGQDGDCSGALGVPGEIHWKRWSSGATPCRSMPCPLRRRHRSVHALVRLLVPPPQQGKGSVYVIGWLRAGRMPFSALLQLFTNTHFSALYVQVRDKGRWLIILSTVSPKCPFFHALWGFGLHLFQIRDVISVCEVPPLPCESVTGLCPAPVPVVTSSQIACCFP